MYRFERLFVWKKSVEACGAVYELSGHLPTEEKFGITSQLRRAVVSIPTNIAEGTGDDSDAEMIRFIRYAIRSQHESVNLIKVSVKLGFLREDLCLDAEEKLASAGRLLHRLKQSLVSPTIREDIQDQELEHDLELLLSRNTNKPIDPNDPMTQRPNDPTTQ